MSTPADQVRKGLRDRLPAPGYTPVERLRHTVAAWPTVLDERMAVTVTQDVYGDGVATGLTWGDLRAILVRLDVAELIDRPWCWEHACESAVCYSEHVDRHVARVRDRLHRES